MYFILYKSLKNLYRCKIYLIKGIDMLRNLIERISIFIVILLSTSLYVNANTYTTNTTDNDKIFSLSYNNVNGDIVANYVIPVKPDGSLNRAHNSWWMVVTDGPHPGNGNNVQLIGDLDSNIITAYSYTPGQNENNYQTGTFLGRFEGALTQNGDSYGFNINIADVNQKSTDLGGSPFEISDNSGVWFKRGVDATIDYNADGSIASYTAHEFKNNIDYSNKTTTVVTPTHNPPSSISEPAGLLIMLSALGLFFRVRKS
jgi:hypothetical protein